MVTNFLSPATLNYLGKVSQEILAQGGMTSGSISATAAGVAGVRNMTVANLAGDHAQKDGLLSVTNNSGLRTVGMGLANVISLPGALQSVVRASGFAIGGIHTAQEIKSQQEQFNRTGVVP